MFTLLGQTNDLSMQRRTHPNAIGCSWRSRQCDVCRRRLKFVQRFQYRSTFLRCVVIVECWLLTELTDSGVGFVASAFGLKWLIKTITNVTLFRRRYLFLHRFIDLNVSIALLKLMHLLCQSFFFLKKMRFVVFFFFLFFLFG